MTIESDYEFKVKFLVLIYHVVKAKEVFWYSREVNKTYEDLEDDLKKSQQKFKALVKSCIYP